MSSGQRLSTAPAGGPLRLTTKSKTVSTMGPSGDYSQAMPRHRRTVQDVMTTAVVAADRLTPYKEIVLLLAEHRISGLPVLADGWQVIGVVSEADLLARRPEGLTAGELMTSPPITVGPDAAIPAVVQAMNRYHVRRLPVTGADRQLIGLVSRRDVLRVFLRPDWDIAADVSRVLGEILTLPAAVDATVRHGVVTLAGPPGPAPRRNQAPASAQGVPSSAVRLIWDIDGVVDVVTTGTWAGPYVTGPGD
jgi:CBS domain-containing protein